ncbi:MAG: ABC transporter substrate-binding protein [Alphaproteobacteria bacterium]|nr:MAG: ABC transporter substrate-binding protein [Alphaproteobacteria bacterium]
MIKKICINTSLIVSFMLVAITPSQAKSRAEYESDAKAFVQKVINKIYDAVQSDVPQDHKEEKFRKALKEDFNLPAIAKFTLGAHQKNFYFPDNEKSNKNNPHFDEFYTRFERLIVEMYASQFGAYKDAQKPEIKSAKFINGGFQVSSVAINPKNNNAKVEVIWTAYPKKGGGFEVTDIIIAKISLALSQRRQFNSDFRSCKQKAQRNAKKTTGTNINHEATACFLKTVAQAADDYDKGTRTTVEITK